MHDDIPWHCRRFWTLEEALFEVRRLSVESNAEHNSRAAGAPAMASSFAYSSNKTTAPLTSVDSLLQGWVMPPSASSAAASDHAFRGRVPQRKKARQHSTSFDKSGSGSGSGGSGGSGGGRGSPLTTRASSKEEEDDAASDLWCKACIDDPEVVYCGFCGCRVSQHNEIHTCTLFINNDMFPFSPLPLPLPLPLSQHVP